MISRPNGQEQFQIFQYMTQLSHQLYTAAVLVFGNFVLDLWEGHQFCYLVEVEVIQFYKLHVQDPVAGVLLQDLYQGYLLQF